MANNYRPTTGFPGGINYPPFSVPPGFMRDARRPYGPYGHYYPTPPNQIAPIYM